MTTIGTEANLAILCPIQPPSGLVVDFTAGRCRVGGTSYDVAFGQLTATDDDTTYMFVNSSGALAQNLTGFPADCIQLVEVVAVSGAITGFNQKRAFLVDDAAGSTSPISFNFIETGAKPYLGTSSTSYLVKGHVQFPGTDAVGTPTKANIGVWVDTGATGAFQIWDVVAGAAIAEKTGVTNTAKVATDMGTLSNLTAAPAIWEIRLKRTGGTGGDEICLSGGVVW